MKKLIFSFICISAFFSCTNDIDGPGLPPLDATYLLLNSDSTSVITSSSDKVLVHYKDKEDGKLRQSYTVRRMKFFMGEHAVTWAVNDTIYQG